MEVIGDGAVTLIDGRDSSRVEGVSRAARSHPEAPGHSSGSAEDTQDDNARAALKQFWNFPGNWNDAIDQWAHNTVG